MKILCVIDSLGSGGAQRQLVNLAIGFKERGHEVSFLVYHSINFFKEFLDDNNIRVHEIIEPNYLRRLLKMRHYIRQGEFDSVLSFLESANFICEVAGLPWRRWKLLVGERSANPKILKSPKLRAYRWFHLLADHVVANSNENIKLIRKINPLLSQKKCKVIYNMVDFEKWKPVETCSSRKNGRFRIVIAASHLYLKNLDGLVEAVNLLSVEEKERLKIDWYGSEGHDLSKEEGLKKIDQYQLESIFSFYKPTLKINEKVQEADAVGLFSFYEGLPNAICEGMALGKPVIAAKVSDVSFLIRNEKLLCNPNEIGSILKSIRYLIQLKPEELNSIGAKNRKFAFQNFDPSKIVNEYLNLF